MEKSNITGNDRNEASNRLTRTFSEDAGLSDCKSPSPLLLICSVRISKHVRLRVGRTEIWKAQRLELSWPLAWNVWWTDRVGIWIWGSQRVREHKERMPFPVPLFCFKWEENICPSTWEGHGCPGTDSANSVDIRSDRIRCCLFSLCCLTARTIKFMTTCMAQDCHVVSSA